MRYANSITPEELRAHLTILAGDPFLGRDTGKEGQKMAAAYLKDQFMAAGIPPVPVSDKGVIAEGYYQPFDVIEVRAGAIKLVSPTGPLEYGKEIAYFNEVLTEERTVEQVLFIGDAAELPKKAMKGATVLIDAKGMGTGAELLGVLRGRLEPVRAAGPALILVSVPELRTMVEGMHLGGTRMSLADTEKPARAMETTAQMIMVDEPAMNSLMKGTRMDRLRKSKVGKRVSVDLQLRVTSTEQRLTAENVLAYIEGGDKKDELIVLTAHYDHIGVENGVVYNGADDDGTGTVAMLEIAEAFALARKEGHGPRRSVLVMPVSGEEKGLLGSRYYSEHPVFPLVNTVADLNIDMIGRTDSLHTTPTPYIYVIGSDRLSSELHQVNELANALYTRMDLDYRYNAESDPNRFYYRSDHYNFARKGVPSIFYFSGVHEDYHQPGDDVEKIQFDLLHKRTQLVFHTAWILANQERRIAVDNPIKP